VVVGVVVGVVGGVGVAVAVVVVVVVVVAKVDDAVVGSTPGPSSIVMPAQRNILTRLEADPGTNLVWSVSSIRRINVPPVARANK
jgi:hypothetical protein